MHRADDCCLPGVFRSPGVGPCHGGLHRPTRTIGMLLLALKLWLPHKLRQMLPLDIPIQPPILPIHHDSLVSFQTTVKRNHFLSLLSFPSDFYYWFLMSFVGTQQCCSKMRRCSGRTAFTVFPKPSPPSRPTQSHSASSSSRRTSLPTLGPPTTTYPLTDLPT